MRRKIYISTGKPGEPRHKAIMTWFVDEENLQEVQAQVAEFIANDLLYGHIENDIEKSGGTI